jgi:hypothetical protein
VKTRVLVAGFLLAATACAKPTYLGAELPAPCRSKDIEGCLGWMVERDLVAAELGVYDDHALRAYVQSVVDRLVPGSLLRATPRVLIADRDGTYATIGGRIVVARPTLEQLGSEAELAGVLAHELAHIEGRHTAAAFYAPHADDEWLTIRRDAEAIADERAVVLLERAGYSPSAMGRALRAVLGVPEDPIAANIPDPDDDHPAIADRLARVDELAANRSGFEGRDEFLAKLSGMIAGRDRRLGDRIGTAWVVAALGVAITLGEDDEIRAEDDVLSVARGDTELTAYVIGGPWARDLGASLEDRKTRNSPLGSVTSGIVPRAVAHDESPLGKLQRAIRSTLPQPNAGARVVIIDRPTGALVLELGGPKDMPFKVRAATDFELSAAEPARIVLEAAPRAGAIESFGICAGRLLDDPSRVVPRGSAIKCSDRPADRPAPLASHVGTARDGSSRARDIRAALQSHLARH